MGEAKKRGTFEERKAAAQLKYNAAKQRATKWEIIVIACALVYASLLIWVFSK